MANFVFTEAPYRFLQAQLNLISDTLKIALLADTYTPDINDEIWGDISAHEITSGGGYTSGGETLSNKTVSKNIGDNRAEFDADDITTPWDTGSFTGARYAVIYRSNSTQYLIYLIDLSYNRDAPIEFNWDGDGIFAIGMCS